MLRRAPPWLSRGRGGSPRPTFLELHHSGRRETRVRGTRLGSRGLGLARLVHHAHGEARSVNWTRAPAASVPRQLDRHNPGRARPKAPATPSSGALESHDEDALRQRQGLRAARAAAPPPRAEDPGRRDWEKAHQCGARVAALSAAPVRPGSSSTPVLCRATSGGHLVVGVVVCP
ncbi:unnamed protein product [Prorocentrum cordatum]|uniref:Uncharacterized protein n=1 Tax=Prorocentrum cordatum TaxID=2364126 RepID=A0ABN9XH33_9DINO|nr:unnamed protein product [Polarella glacialis]